MAQRTIRHYDNLDVLDEIDAFIRANGIAPTLRELSARLKFTAPAAARHHIRRLVAQGFLSVRQGGVHNHFAARSMQITPKGRAALETRKEVHAQTESPEHAALT